MYWWVHAPMLGRASGISLLHIRPRGHSSVEHICVARLALGRWFCVRGKDIHAALLQAARPVADTRTNFNQRRKAR